MINLGDFDVSQVIDFKFTSRGSTGLPTTLSGSPAVLVYKSNSTTESASTGITLTADFDGLTGLNHVRIDMSANTSFFATANDFDIVLTAGTVGGVSVVGEAVAHFTIRNRAGLYPAVAARTLAVDASGRTDLGSALGVAVTLDANNVLNVSAKYWAGGLIAAPTNTGVPNVNVKTINDVSTSAVTTVKASQGLTTADTIATYTGNTPQTGDAYARIGAAGAGLTALGDTRIANLDATVSSRLPTSTYTVPPTAASIAALILVTPANKLATDGSGFASLADQPTLTKQNAILTAVAAVPTATANAAATAAQITTDHGTGSYYTNNAIIAGAVWDVVIASHQTAGTTGKTLSLAGGSGGPFGPGTDNCTLNFKTTGGANLVGAQVWLTYDTTPTNVAAGTLSTDANGNVTFLLFAGNTYYCWMIDAGQNPIRGEPFVAVVDP